MTNCTDEYIPLNEFREDKRNDVLGALVFIDPKQRTAFTKENVISLPLTEVFTITNSSKNGVCLNFRGKNNWVSSKYLMTRNPLYKPYP